MKYLFLVLVFLLPGCKELKGIQVHSAKSYKQPERKLPYPEYYATAIGPVNSIEVKIHNPTVFVFRLRVRCQWLWHSYVRFDLSHSLKSPPRTSRKVVFSHLKEDGLSARCMTLQLSGPLSQKTSFGRVWRSVEW